MLKSWRNNNNCITSSKKYNNNKKDDDDDDDDITVIHRKRLAQILRYIANMHQSVSSSHNNNNNISNNTTECSFVQNIDNDNLIHVNTISNFFFNENNRNNNNHNDENFGSNSNVGVLFTTDSFRYLLTIERNFCTTSETSSPFTFYTVPSDEQSCWLRVIRISTHIKQEPPISNHIEVQQYLHDWLQNSNISNVRTIDKLLTLHRIERYAPKISPTVSIDGGYAIKSYLRQYKRYLRKKQYNEHIEPIYNQLFEWIQNQNNQHSQELIWGLGHARKIITNEDNNGQQTLYYVNGPVLEVQVQVELARDGALLVRPREHTGVTINRQVLLAISSTTSDNNNNDNKLQKLHRLVSEIVPSTLSPAQPETYVHILKQIALNVSATGRFQLSTTSAKRSSMNTTDLNNDSSLIITEEWCLFTRTKPSSVFARDAILFADKIQQQQKETTEFELPRAALSLTHGPSTLELQCQKQFDNSNNKPGVRVYKWLTSAFSIVGGKNNVMNNNDNTTTTRTIFPLPASDTQHRIADLLINQNMPAVVCEGPPGSGKTQTIANIICAYLCSGKRVLVTSKNAPALSVLRSRLPNSVQELCVDVSMSELQGMRQLQKTVERLANRVASVNSDLENQRYIYLQNSIQEHTKELEDIDERTSILTKELQMVLKQPDGQKLVELYCELIDSVPWLMKTISKWTPIEVSSLKDRVAALVLKNPKSYEEVSGYSYPPSKELISLCGCKAGETVSIVSNVMKQSFTIVPFLGSRIKEEVSELEKSLSDLRICGELPTSKYDWHLVLQAMKHSRDIYDFEQEIWNEQRIKNDWPHNKCLKNNDFMTKLLIDLEKAVTAKQTTWSLNAWSKIELATECRSLDAKRTVLSSRIQSLAEELVNASVVSSLSRSFSADAQSALIRFAQLAGKTRFSKSQQPSKMTQRQRRRRQEYLAAFDRCCRFIPCWILTTTQISDYLPAECLFDLVITDESSQSDVTILPGILRGRQWLIVGDGKQVSPIENFVSEEHIDSLRAALPESPLEESLLPGQSFFDLCAQAFPKSRVVLNEHFRSTSQIIAFSNKQFYDDMLVPLRLPLKSERIDPCLVDVRLQNGVKEGKVNEKEADEIVRRVAETVTCPSAATNPRSIGIISLIGDEQSRLIRGRLLDAIEPHLIARHDILVGEPPAFQGAERDIIFLSMVCSPGSAPTQNQLMHFQRCNVAMSRARDQCILVRSLDISDIPNNDDMKIPVIEFFQSASSENNNSDESAPSDNTLDTNITSLPSIHGIVAKLLIAEKFIVRSMGLVWKNAICVEHPEADARAAIIVDSSDETLDQDWQASYRQQKAIERVGWKCLRIDGLSLLTDVSGSLDVITRFLSSAGVEGPRIIYDELEDEEISDDIKDVEPNEVVAAVDNQHPPEQVHHENAMDQDENNNENYNEEDEESQVLIVEPEREDAEIVEISSDDEQADYSTSLPVNTRQVKLENTDVEMAASSFGNVADLSFLRADGNSSTSHGHQNHSENDDEDSNIEGHDQPHPNQEMLSSRRRGRRRRKYRRLLVEQGTTNDDEEEYNEDDERFDVNRKGKNVTGNSDKSDEDYEFEE